ncbi:MAG: 50S ribosomal protein L18 [Candidatus Heimdallarchaeota archaeon]|nr:50S ribosomal protein L18 [Candidatus Heimdallarchaeota archaeon]
MAKNARYRVPFRRRREGKTNYHLRRRLVKSNAIRAVVRVTNGHCLVQFVEANIYGDKTLSSTHSKELKSFNWLVATSNLPSAYLVGYLAGFKAKKAGIAGAILDIGLNPPVYGSRVFSALKGVVDSGIDIPHSDKIFPDDKRINGTHISEYANALKEDNKDFYDKQFSKYHKNKIDPTKIPKLFNDSKNMIESKFQ